MKYYVTMNDKFLSGWGCSQGKINTLIFECDSMEEANIVYDNAKARGDMIYVNICTRKPYKNSKTHYVQWKNKEEYPSWYIKDYFKKN